MDRYPLSHDDVRDRIPRVFDISDSPCARRASLDAGGLQALIDPVVTEIALFCDVVYRVKKSHSIGAGHDAVPAPDAPFLVHQDHPICGLVGSAHRAYLDAGRFGALVAKLGYEKGFIDVRARDIFEVPLPEINPAGGEPHPCFLGAVRKHFPFFGNDVSLHPRPGDVRLKRDFILQLAGLDTEPAADALVGIHQKRPPEGSGGGLEGSRTENFAYPFGQGYGGGPSQHGF
jgi:hypothetical protein